MSKKFGELEKLTDGENLLLDRKRSGETQAKRAKKLGVTRTIYGLWERSKSCTIDLPKIQKAEPNELCLLYRRRAGFTQERVAEELKCCRWSINQMEQGKTNCDTLLWYWEQ